MYCCGKRKEDCKCFSAGRGLKIAQSFQKKAFSGYPRKNMKSRIQTWRDTADMPSYAEQIGWSEEYEYTWLFPTAVFWRRFSNQHFWRALEECGAVEVNAVPDWGKVANVMKAFQAQGESYFGGFFYSGNVLTKYRYNPHDAWALCQDMNSIEKEIQAVKLVYHTARLMKESFSQLQERPSRELWRACTEDFLEGIRQRVSGVFDHYYMKIALDGILISQPELERVLSWWPMLCPAYRSELPKLYPIIKKTQEDLFLAACYFHRQVKGHLHMVLFERQLSPTMLD
jgi:hypothetical protein